MTNLTSINICEITITNVKRYQVMYNNDLKSDYKNKCIILYNNHYKSDYKYKHYV